MNPLLNIIHKYSNNKLHINNEYHNTWEYSEDENLLCNKDDGFYSNNKSLNYRHLNGSSYSNYIWNIYLCERSALLPVKY